MTEHNDVIVFNNLVQGTSTVGEKARITAKAQAFVAKNAHGVLRDVSSYDEVRAIAESSARKTLALIDSSN